MKKQCGCSLIRRSLCGFAGFAVEIELSLLYLSDRKESNALFCPELGIAGAICLLWRSSQAFSPALRSFLSFRHVCFRCGVHKITSQAGHVTFWPRDGRDTFFRLKTRTLRAKKTGF